MTTQTLDTTVVESTDIPVVFSITDARIEQMKAECAGLVATDKASYETLRKSLSVVRTARTEIEKRRKFLKEDALKYGRRIDEMAKKLTARVVAIEDPLKAESERYEKEQERIRFEKENAERLAREAEAKAAREAEEARLKALRDAEEARLAEQRKQFEAERAEAEEKQRIENSRLAAERAEIAEQNRIERERMEAERAKFLEEQRIEREQIEAARRAERERLAKIEAEQLAERNRLKAIQDDIDAKARWDSLRIGPPSVATPYVPETEAEAQEIINEQVTELTQFRRPLAAQVRKVDPNKVPHALILQLIAASDALDVWVDGSTIPEGHPIMDSANDLNSCILAVISDDDFGDSNFAAVNSDWNCFAGIRRNLKGN